MAETIDINTIRFSVFRAVDNVDVCKKYIDGHIHVLKVYGITQITSAKIDWILNPNVYVIIVESLEDGEILAGARIQLADGKHPLPIEDAIGHKDGRVYSYVENLREEGVGELCGLWNSRKIAGFGIGSIFLGRTSVAVASQLNIKSLLALCAPSTKRNCFRTGFTVEKSLGNEGEFFYPKEDLVATALIIKDVNSLDDANEEERELIMELRKHPEHDVIEETKRGDVHVYYELNLPHIRIHNALTV